MHGNAVVPSFLSMYPKNMFEELIIENVGSVYINTQANLLAMMKLTFTRYGGWSTVKGDRNYYDLMKFPNFTTRPLVHTGIYTAKESRAERVGWGRVAHELTDDFYKEFLVARMKNWDVLAHLQQVFEADETLSFKQCCAQLLRKMTKLENEEASMTHVIQKLAIASAGPVKGASTLDTSAFQYEVQAAQSSAESVCFNCDRPGHFKNRCPYPLRTGGGLRSGQPMQYRPQYQRQIMTHSLQNFETGRDPIHPIHCHLRCRRHR